MSNMYYSLKKSCIKKNNNESFSANIFTFSLS